MKNPCAKAGTNACEMVDRIISIRLDLRPPPTELRDSDNGEKVGCGERGTLGHTRPPVQPGRPLNARAPASGSGL